MLLHSLPVIEIRSMPQGKVEGMASTFNGVDHVGDTVMPGAFSQTLAEHARAGTSPAMLLAHDQSVPVGKWETLKQTDRGLHVTGQLAMRTDAGQQVFEHLKAGSLAGMSMGFSVPPGGSKQEGDIRQLHNVKLHEVSLVTLHADPGARVLSVKSLELRPETAREFQVALQGMGFSRREAAAISLKGFAGFDPDPDDVDDTERAERAKAIAAALRSLTQSLTR